MHRAGLMSGRSVSGSPACVRRSARSALKQRLNDRNTFVCPLNHTCVHLQPLRAHSFNTRHSKPQGASPRPASRHASAASLTAVTDDQQFEEVIVVAGHAGGGRLKPRAFAAASRLSPAERLAGTRLTSRPDRSGQFHPDRCRKQRICRRGLVVSAVSRSLPETALPPAAPARRRTNQSAPTPYDVTVVNKPASRYKGSKDAYICCIWVNGVKSIKLF